MCNSISLMIPFSPNNGIYHVDAFAEVLRERIKEVLAGPPAPVLYDQTGLAHAPDTWLDLLRPLGIDNRMAAIRAANTYERRRMEEMKPLPEIRKFLEIIRRSLRVVILADGAAAHQKSSLRRMRMDELAHVLLFDEEIGLKPPDPALFRAVLGRIDAAPEEAAFAGDDAAIDLPGAKAVGIFTILRRLEGAPVVPAPAADFAVDTFLELFPRLERRMGDR